MTVKNTRKWTAEIGVAGQDVTPLLDLTDVRDTLKDTSDAGIALAARMINEEMGSDASVVLLKQLASDDAPKRDRALYVYRDWNAAGDAVVRVQR